MHAWNDRVLFEYETPGDQDKVGQNSNSSRYQRILIFLIEQEILSNIPSFE
jgi:hypothetical protein